MQENKELHEYEEYHEWNEFWSWAFIVFLSGSLITLMMVIMSVKVAPREWDFGNVGFTPSESIYSTQDPGPVLENMIQPLPEGVSMEESKNAEQVYYDK